ncbi:Uncharacterized protein RNJ44_01524 [Nakaseomyces bracarensis]|uniref:Translation initiation factor eIF2 assembly protein n=1 Tax=Nakaseomyces bracarensis TaxID=273131 RepID=A0ABR4NQ35_9SACH
MDSEEYTPLSELPVTCEQVEHCAYSFWYEKFKSHIPKTRIIKPLPQQFIQYLEQDGIKLPISSNELSSYTDDIVRSEENEYSDWEADEDTATEYEPGIEPLNDFPEFHQQLKDIISELGPVTPKLNWSAPKDATWILPNNTMKCNEVNEIYLLLNASNYIVHDLEHAFDECVDKKQGEPEYELILRQWFNINPALEFRVFVKDGKVVGATQRDLNYYDYLEKLSDTLKDLIDEFVEDVVVPGFPDKSFVIDLYIPRPFNRVYLIDINPFARKTDSHLFTWNEIIEIDTTEDKDYEMRLVTEHNTGRFASKEHSQNHVPKDVVDASLDPEKIKELTEKWSEMLLKQQQDVSDEE